MNKILLIEDDLTYSKIIKNFLEKNNYAVHQAYSVSDGLSALSQGAYDLIITDYRLPDGTGMDILERTIKQQTNVPIILITNHSDIRTAVKFMKLGAYEYITKPIQPDELLLTVNSALSQPTKGTNKVENPEESDSAGFSPSNLANVEYFVGKSQLSKTLESHVELVAPTDMSVFVFGESGTGKEFISKRIHELSGRKHGPFVAVDCGSLSKELAGSELFGHVKGAFTGAIDNKKGHFESAEGGTLFLDEIGNLSYEIQIKLLRAIQERKIRKIGGNKDISVDVRIIAATNDDLLDSSRIGHFREDLYHRLNEFSIKALPLRERQEDLLYFAALFLAKSNELLSKNVAGFSKEVVHIFKTYSWPGNLRELKNIIKRAVLLTGEGFVQPSAIPEELAQQEMVETEGDSTIGLKQSFEEKEKALIEKVLIETKFNKSKAAKILNMDRKTLYNKLDKYQIAY
ncbi:sigma-54-dependent transcriptional regulator [Lunatibacter salilacus]|uniref:sigma-54-dependent transcriptional regulator n=1 Tax=Lunatibacter salilacus TaxID=2483804 RepID=UPI00131BCFB9|nr:sigma-54 dependent transcriptional regulator [Lunatibacter salilacus]